MISAKEILVVKACMIQILTDIVTREDLVTNLITIADICNISDEKDFVDKSLLNNTCFFVQDSLRLIDLKLYDDWIELLKAKLLKNEDYEIVVELDL